MRTFTESDHPRAETGEFVRKVNDAPTGSLQDEWDEDEDTCECGASLDDGEGSNGLCGNCADRMSCLRCFEEKDDESSVLCADCSRDDSICRNCASDVGEGDCVECVGARQEAADAKVQRRRDEEIKWGATGVHLGSRTPWGTADHVTDIAPGITSVSTPGHGGVKLSPARNAVIPPAYRERSGWYEEDCEANIPVLHFADEFAAQPHMKTTADQLRASADQSIKTWFPDKWEKVNGRELQPGESSEKDRLMWTERHADQPIVRSAINSKTIPGMVRVTAQPHVGGAEPAEYLVPVDEYEARRQNPEPGADGRFVVDPSRHPKLPPAPAAPAAAEKTLHTFEFPDLFELRADDTLTSTARDRIIGDVHKRWRLLDGQVKTLGEILEQDGVVGVRMQNAGRGKVEYRVDLPSGALQVTKATYEYLGRTIPNSATPEQIAATEYFVASAKLEEFTQNGDYELWRDEKAKVRARKLTAAMTDAHNAWRAEQAAAEQQRIAREGTAEDRAAAAERLLAERERAARVEGA